MAMSTHLLSFILFLALSSSAVSYGRSLHNCTMQPSNCLYTITVKTGDVEDAGTDSVISLKFSNTKNDKPLDISNLGAIGAMEPEHDYFERDKVDAFSIAAHCTDSELCLLQLSSDNSGDSPGWYVNYVNILVTGPNVNYKQSFRVDQWLDLNKKPGSLKAVRDNCPKANCGLDASAARGTAATA